MFKCIHFILFFFYREALPFLSLSIFSFFFTIVFILLSCKSPRLHFTLLQCLFFLLRLGFFYFKRSLLSFFLSLSFSYTPSLLLFSFSKLCILKVLFHDCADHGAVYSLYCLVVGGGWTTEVRCGVYVTRDSTTIAYQ